MARPDKYKVVDGVELKRCSSCGEYLPKENFSKRRASPDGLGYSCKACERETAKKSYKRGEIKKKSQQRYQDNKEKYKEAARQRYAENSEEIKIQQAAWRKTVKGKKIMNEASARRRERMIAQTPGGRDYVDEEIILRDSCEGVCLCQICGEPIDLTKGELHLDHIIPIAAGGSDTRDNIRCTHKQCNLERPKDGRDLNE